MPSEFYFRACEFFLQSILNLRPCGTGYWLLTALQVPLALVLTLLSALHLHQPHKQAPPELQVILTFSSHFRLELYMISLSDKATIFPQDVVLLLP